jgi:hypothetical protein
LTKDEAMNLRLGKHQLIGTPEPEVKARITIKVGAGTYELTGTGVECIECRITNGATNAEKAMAEVKLRATGVTVMQPSSECEVPGGAITSNLLLEHSDWVHEGKTFVKLEPKAGPTTAFATVQLTECPFNASLVVKGYVFGESLSKSGEAQKNR